MYSRRQIFVPHCVIVLHCHFHCLVCIQSDLTYFNLAPLLSGAFFCGMGLKYWLCTGLFRTREFRLWQRAFVYKQVSLSTSPTPPSIRHVDSMYARVVCHEIVKCTCNSVAVHVHCTCKYMYEMQSRLELTCTCMSQSAICHNLYTCTIRIHVYMYMISPKKNWGPGNPVPSAL